MHSFKHLGLSNAALKVISELGFEEPSEIQEQAIPQLISGDHDFVGLAQTGTGKTAAFGLPLLERIDPFYRVTQALILSPTRELGQQIAEQLKTFSRYQEKINVLAVYGGTSITQQMKSLRKNPQHLIIATPGRLIDLMNRKAIDLSEIQFLVLDEADEMLNMGFRDDLDRILKDTPSDKLTWLFSATMPKEIRRIADTYMKSPVTVRIDPKNEVNQNIEHQYVMVRRKDKSEALMRFLDLDTDMRGIIFCRTRRETQDLAVQLQKRGYLTDALHGDLSQSQRDRVMDRFKNEDIRVLIATDVAARGIDVSDLSHIFHYTLPDDEAFYTHRSGRTARAGKKGTSVAFIGGSDKNRILKLERELDIKFEKIYVPNTNLIQDVRLENWCREILEKKHKQKVDPELLEKVQLLFGNLSKDELIAKILADMIDRMDIGTGGDLNEKEGSSQKRSHNQNRKKNYGRKKKYQSGKKRRKRR